jgi:hypothetical protein
MYDLYSVSSEYFGCTLVETKVEGVGQSETRRQNREFTETTLPPQTPFLSSDWLLSLSRGNNFLLSNFTFVVKCYHKPKPFHTFIDNV